MINGVGLEDDVGVHDVSSSKLVKVGSSRDLALASLLPSFAIATLCDPAWMSLACALFVAAISQSTL